MKVYTRAAPNTTSFRAEPYTLVMNADGLRSTEVSPLKQIYQKQSVSRQADLVRLVLSIAEAWYPLDSGDPNIL